MSGGDRPVVDHGSAQSGDQTYGNVAGGDIHQGADANRVLAMVELLVKNAWDDQQQRDIRQRQHDRERREERDRADYHREMTRQRLEKIAGDVERLTGDVAVTQRLGREARRWLIGLTVAVVVIGMVLIGVVVDRMVAAAGLMLVAGLAARLMGR